MSEASIRLYLDHPLAPGQPVPLDAAQAHYLFSVMRRNAGDLVLLFNGRDGEWLARIIEAGRRGGMLIPERETRPQLAPPDLWLVFAPVKKARTDFIVEKAVELGVSRILPVQTDHTNSERLKQDRLAAHAREAAEQCGALSVPPVEDMQSLSRLLDRWPAGRQLAFADEAATAGSFDRAAPGPWAVLIGPEGGFSARERARLTAMPHVTRISLGPRILRADTAAVAALTLWQARLGDWQDAAAPGKDEAYSPAPASFPAVDPATGPVADGPDLDPFEFAPVESPDSHGDILQPEPVDDAQS